MIETITQVNSTVNGIVWGPIMIALLLGTGVYLSIRTGFLQVGKFGFIFKRTILTAFKKDPNAVKGEGDVSPFQALTTALAATVGTGNIAGVAGAIAVGGPGAIFWMWVCAFFGMTTKYSEILLAVKYRETNDKGEFSGGPMYYISKGLNMKWLAVLFSLFGFLACFGIGNMTQVNTIASSLNTTFGISPMITGVALVILAAIVILGGIKRIATVTEKIVPFMAVFYIVAAIAVICMNYQAIIPSFALIFKCAFTPAAATGGFAGATIMLAVQKGMARGIFSNEAGLGSAPIAHATAKTNHPAKQAMWGVFEVFIDTIVLCTLTALVIMTSGVWDSGVSGAPLTIMAFSDGLHSAAGAVVSIAVFFFAFSTLISWSFYGERCLGFLMGSTKGSLAFKLVFLAVIMLGANMELTLVWDIADTLNGLMAIPNLVGLLGLSTIIISVTKEFFANPDDPNSPNKC